MIDFNRLNFYPIKKKLLTTDIHKLLSKYIIKSNVQSLFEINDVSSLNKIRNNSILVLINDQKIDFASKKVLVLTNNEIIFNKHLENNILLIKDLTNFYNILINHIYIHDESLDADDDFIYQSGSFISKYSFIDTSAKIGVNCIIGRGVKIGKNSIIKNNVSVKYSIIGSNVVISDNTTLGNTGFGFDYHNRGSLNITPHLGIVYIDDNTHIGSSCTIDRGKIDETYIGKNGMLDNLIHVAHNVEIGDNVCIAAQSGISGSVKIGSNVTIGGQVGLAGHINIGDNVIVAAKSGVTKNIKSNSTIAGFPAIDIKEWKKKIIREKRNGYKLNSKSTTS
jgi:UDP-3-O-[3-hydroxymyristoyl] glucosamine N-acyltransferase LpxD